MNDFFDALDNQKEHVSDMAAMEDDVRVKREIETETCSRCGGGGHYSYCQRFGTTCFKCSGKGKVYTKRGRIARDLYQRLLSKPTTDLKVGDLVWYDGCPGFSKSRFVAVTDIYLQTAERNGGGYSMKDDHPFYHGYIVECGDDCHFISESADKLWRIGSTAEQKKAALAQALDYQDTLTKTGTVRKLKGARQ